MKTLNNKPDEDFRIVLALTGIILASIIIVRELLIIKISSFTIITSFILALAGAAVSFIVTRKIKPDLDRNPIAKLFISFSRFDKDFVDKLSIDLREVGFQVLRGDELLLVGDNIKQKMSSAMSRADFFIVVLSSNIYKTKNILQETNYAIKNDKRVFPILIEERIEVPSVLSNIFYVDFTKDYQMALEILINSINENLISLDIPQINQKDNRAL